MSKTKIVATAVISLVGFSILIKMFIAATTDKSGSTREFADKSQQALEDYKKALAESRSELNKLPTNTINTPTSGKISEQPSLFNFPKVTCGDKPSSDNDRWYPVFINGGNLENIRLQFCSDAVATTRKDTGERTVQLASFTKRESALDFAKAVGGDVGEPTIAKLSLSTLEPDKPNPPKAQSIPETPNKQKTAEQTRQAAVNLCHEEHIKSQELVNKTRSAMAEYPSNPMSDAGEGLANVQEELAKAELQRCLTAAQAKK